MRRATARAALAALLVFAAPTSAPFAQPAPSAPVFSPTAPPDVVLPAGFNGQPRDAVPFFDHFSWRAFIAITWAADQRARGAPDLNAPVEATGPRAFEGFKANWETFRPNGAAPPLWDATPSSPCGSGSGPGDLVIVEAGKFGEVGQADTGRLVGPLIAQNRTYVRYLTGYNRLQFEHIASAGLYLRANLGGPESPDGAIAVKSAWIDLTNVAAPERFYRRRAWVFDYDTNQCVEREVGLVGLHIVIKTPSRPQWIWSAFEHVDVVDNASDSSSDLVLNDRSNTPMPVRNPHSFPPPAPTPPPYNVQRLVPINSDTAAANRIWRQALAARSSIWSNYQLVMTQWPLRRDINHGRPSNTFPGSGAGNASSSFANVTMETFHQVDIRSGCMACHDGARTQSDFIWSVETHAFPLDDLQPESGLAAFFTATEDDRAMSRLRGTLRIGAHAQERTMSERDVQ